MECSCGRRLLSTKDLAGVWQRLAETDCPLLDLWTWPWLLTTIPRLSRVYISQVYIPRKRSTNTYHIHKWSFCSNYNLFLAIKCNASVFDLWTKWCWMCSRQHIYSVRWGGCGLPRQSIFTTMPVDCVCLREGVVYVYILRIKGWWQSQPTTAFVVFKALDSFILTVKLLPTELLVTIISFA